jgi:hypothetical protein
VSATMVVIAFNWSNKFAITCLLKINLKSADAAVLYKI